MRQAFECVRKGIGHRVCAIRSLSRLDVQLDETTAGGHDVLLFLELHAFLISSS